ncbi:hypothetical protein [Microbulbifer agarilyticus]|uniref:hypothetical protein n=1 Tax=Microbulbifer agarilyticus TaxID=260552 RepID=UPI001CD35387|nr:hypothetical protein [Microbulbifer agarilyticus]MCA0895119.1 hypothetical protein [Microbulbifer agarilyticus]
MSKRTKFVYLAGMLPILFVVGLLVFLTFENFLSSQAIFGDKFGNVYAVEGNAAVLVNLGIFGLVGWLVSYLVFLVSRNHSLLLVHRFIGAVSILCIVAGLLYGLS